MSKTIDGAGARHVQPPEPSRSNKADDAGGAEGSGESNRAAAQQNRTEVPGHDGQSDFTPATPAANDNKVNLTGAGPTDPAKSARDAQTDYSQFLTMASINANQPAGQRGSWMDRSNLNNQVFANYAAAHANDPVYLANLVKNLKDHPPADNTVSLATLSQLQGPQRQAVVTALRAGYEQGTLDDKAVYGPAGKPASANDPVAALWNEARKGAAPPADPGSKAALDLLSSMKDGVTVGTAVAEAIGSKLGLSAEYFSAAAGGFANLGNGAANVADALMRLPGATEAQRPALLAQLARGAADMGTGLMAFRDLENKVPNLKNAMRASGLGNLLDGALTFLTPGHSTEQGLEAAAKIALGTMQLVPPLSGAAKVMDVLLAGTKLAGGLSFAAGMIERDAPKLAELLKSSLV